MFMFVCSMNIAQCEMGIIVRLANKEELLIYVDGTYKEGQMYFRFLFTNEHYTALLVQIEPLTF